MVTILGLSSSQSAAAAMIVAVNGDKKPKVKKSGVEEQVANNRRRLPFQRPRRPFQWKGFCCCPVANRRAARFRPIKPGAPARP